MSEQNMNTDEEQITVTLTMENDEEIDCAVLTLSLIHIYSSGGMIECVITGVPAGIGEPVFHKLDAALCSAVMSIGAVKGVEIGDGFQAAAALGSKNNDSFRLDAGKLTKATNHSGGTLGGMSDGSPIILDVYKRQCQQCSWLRIFVILCCPHLMLSNFCGNNCFTICLEMCIRDSLSSSSPSFTPLHNTI